MNIKRGEIYYIQNAKTLNLDEDSTNIQSSARPAIVVSNNAANENSQFLEVVYLTTARKKNLPTHVKVLASVESTALCENIESVDVNRFGNYVRTLDETEMQNINRALSISLDIPSNNLDSPTLGFYAMKAKIYEKLYSDLLTKVLENKN